MTSRLLREFLVIEQEATSLVSTLRQLQEKRISCQQTSCKALEDSFVGFKDALDAALIREGEDVLVNLRAVMLRLKVLARKASEMAEKANPPSLQEESNAFVLQAEYVRKARLVDTIEGLGQMQGLRFVYSLERAFAVDASCIPGNEA